MPVSGIFPGWVTGMKSAKVDAVTHSAFIDKGDADMIPFGSLVDMVLASAHYRPNLQARLWGQDKSSYRLPEACNHAPFARWEVCSPCHNQICQHFRRIEAIEGRSNISCLIG